jgi:hypothetical protein
MIDFDESEIPERFLELIERLERIESEQQGQRGTAAAAQDAADERDPSKLTEKIKALIGRRLQL